MAMHKERIITREDNQEFNNLVWQVVNKSGPNLLFPMLLACVDHIVQTEKGVQVIFKAAFLEMQNES